MTVKHFSHNYSRSWVVCVCVCMDGAGNQLSFECRFYEFNPSCHFIFYLENFPLTIVMEERQFATQKHRHCDEEWSHIKINFILVSARSKPSFFILLLRAAVKKLFFLIKTREKFLVAPFFASNF